MKRFTCILVFTASACFCLSGQDTGPVSGSSFQNYSVTGSVATWSNLSGAYSLDYDEASAGPLLVTGVTDYLVISGFNFSLPSNSIVDGILVEVNRRASDNSGAKDNSIRMVVGGVISGNEKGTSPASWQSSPTYKTYGGSSDTWGMTLTSSQVNSSGFGFAISAKRSGSQNITMFVDHVRMTLYYSNGALPVQLFRFRAENFRDYIQLKWMTASESNTSHFNIQRSSGGNFETIGTIRAHGNSASILKYKFIDKSPQGGLYRLEIVDFNGNTEFSPVVETTDEVTGDWNIYPNPATEIITVEGEGYEMVSLSDATGKTIIENPLEGRDLVTLDVRHLPSGWYVLTLINGRDDARQKIFID